MQSMRHRGFTLIELLVVIAIIGILASVIVASLNDSKKAARDAVRLNDMRQLNGALELYANQNGYKYPTSLSLLAPAYLGRVPTDPSSGLAYTYSTSVASILNCGGSGGAFGTGYHLGTSLENKGAAVLTNDADAAANVFGASALCGTGFSGLTAASGGQACAGAAGTAQPTAAANGESCYDILSQ